MENVKKILTAVDFSESSEKALESAAGMAKMMGAELIIAHVHSVPSSDQGEGMLYAGFDNEEPESREKRLRAIRPTVDGVEFQHRLLKGNPAKEILKLADAEGVGLIVLGTHGRTGLARLLMGSVAEEVVRHATCPVMMIRLPKALKPAD